MGWRSWVLAAGFALAAAACDRPPGDVSPGSAPPPMKTPVGPIPGPPQNVERPANPFGNDRAAHDAAPFSVAMRPPTVRFATLERDGFEPSVPGKRDVDFRD